MLPVPHQLSVVAKSPRLAIVCAVETRKIAPQSPPHQMKFVLGSRRRAGNFRQRLMPGPPASARGCLATALLVVDRSPPARICSSTPSCCRICRSRGTRATPRNGSSRRVSHHVGIVRRLRLMLRPRLRVFLLIYQRLKTQWISRRTICHSLPSIAEPVPELGHRLVRSLLQLD